VVGDNRRLTSSSFPCNMMNDTDRLVTMELVKVLLSLSFAEALRPWLQLRDLMRVVTGNSSVELQGPPQIIDDRDKKQRVVLEFRAITLEQEGVGSINDNVSYVVDFVTKVHGASSLPRISKTRTDALFIESYALPFHELLALVKERYLQLSPLVDSATDVGLIMDQHEGRIVKHIQIGPMEREQLQSMFLRWPRQKLPERFLFLALGYEQDGEGEFAPDCFREFLQTAVKWQIQQAETNVRYLSGEER